MSVRQYIGARYVPKFFENPNNTSEWLPNVIYEPLTIVTYGLNTYTSKKNVPASIGNPAENPSYWVSTGNYNAYMREIDEKINDINDSIDKIIENEYIINDNSSDLDVSVSNALSEGYNVIKITEGNYNLRNTITLLPHQRIIGIGVVKIYSTANVAFNLNGYTENYEELHQYYANFGKWLSNLFLYGTRNNDTCIKFGGDRSVADELYNLIASITLDNLTIRNYQTAIKWTSFNFYLNTFNNLFIELCDNAIESGVLNESVYNSGERITFRDCIFGNVHNVLNSISSSFEFVFDACSFDYCTIVLHDIGNYNKYFICNSHIESIGRPNENSGIYYSSAVKSSYVNIDNCVIDYGITSRNNTLFTNAPTFTFICNCYLSYSGNGETIFISDRRLLVNNNRIQDNAGQLVSPNNNMIIDGDFNNVSLSGTPPVQDTKIGTIYYMGYRAGISDFTTSSFTDFSANGKKIRITGNNTSMSCVLFAKNILVNPDNIYRYNMIYSTNTPGITCRITVLNIDDNEQTKIISDVNFNCINDGNVHFGNTIGAMIAPSYCNKINLRFDISCDNMTDAQYFDILLPIMTKE